MIAICFGPRCSGGVGRFLSLSSSDIRGMFSGNISISDCSVVGRSSVSVYGARLWLPHALV